MLTPWSAVRWTVLSGHFCDRLAGCPLRGDLDSRSVVRGPSNTIPIQRVDEHCIGYL